MQKLLPSYGIVKNEGKCIAQLKVLIKDFRRLSDDVVVKKVNARVKEINKRRYFNFNYDEIKERDPRVDDKYINVMWVDTGYHNVVGEPIYLQFTRGGGVWTGCFVGSAYSILEYQKDYRTAKYGKPNIGILEQDKTSSNLSESASCIKTDLTCEDAVQPIKEGTKVNHNDLFLNTLYEKLLTPQSWTIPALDIYINSCLARLNHMIANGENVSNFVIYNESRSLALINSGLLDKFGNYILLITKLFYIKSGRSDELGYTNLRVAGCKVSLCEDGFRKGQLSNTLDRVSFTKNGASDLLFTASIDDFDLDSRTRLEHCIIERNFRFPESFANATEEMICADITKAVELGVELNKYDHNYIKPIYNRKKDAVHFVIPYHVGNDFKKKPELGIVVAFVAGYWQIMTILEYEQVMVDIKVFNMYENVTF